MEQMREYSQESHGKQRPEMRIEGRIERPFIETPPSDITPIELEDIHWENGTALRFHNVGRALLPLGHFGMEIPLILYVADLEMNDGERVAHLSSLTSKGKPTLFTGSQSGFFAFDPAIARKNDPYYLIGVESEELKETIASLSAVYHEMGHVKIMHEGYDLSLVEAALKRDGDFLPPVLNAARYATPMVKHMPEPDKKVTIGRLRELVHQNRMVNHHLSVFHERNAWAAGANIAHAKKLPLGFERWSSYVEYAKFCLKTYEDERGDRRYTGGLRQPNLC